MTLPARRVPTAPDATILPFCTTAAARAGSSNRTRIGSSVESRETPVARRGICADGGSIGNASNATSRAVATRPLRNMDFSLMISTSHRGGLRPPGHATSRRDYDQDAGDCHARSSVPMKLPKITRGRLLLIVLATWAILMIVPDLYRVFGSLASFGFVAD